MMMPPGLKMQNKFKILETDEEEENDFIVNEGTRCGKVCVRACDSGLNARIKGVPGLSAQTGGGDEKVEKTFANHGACFRDGFKDHGSDNTKGGHHFGGCKNIVGINAVSASTGRRAAMRFNVAPVQRPLASAAKVVEAGNKIVMSKKESYVENETTGERMPLRIERGTFVFDVDFQGGQHGTITLDSGAGVNVWPEGLLPELPMQPPEKGLKMTAANGTEIPSRGVKTIEFVTRSGADRSGFTRRM
jgi:hypothetical protein